MIFKSPFPALDVPEVSLGEFVLGAAHRRGDRPALIDGVTGRRIGYAELINLVDRVAFNLAERGFQKGDVFSIYSPNLPEYPIAFHAVARLGGINTTSNPVYTSEELSYQLKESRARFLLTVPALLDRARAAAADTRVEEIFVVGEAQGATPFAALLETGGRPPDVLINPREDVVALPFSSGTTGLPKGVMLTHYNLVANMCQLDGCGHSTADDTLIATLPLFHIYGMVVIMNLGLAKGASIVTLSRFDLEEMLRIMQDYRVTFAHLVPPLVLAMARHPAVAKYDLSSLRGIFSGAAPLSEDLTRECCERLKCTLRQGYGMTETSPATHATPETGAGVKYGSVGVCVPNTECRIVDIETGDEKGINETGEIHVRGPQVMKGYLNRADETARTIDSEGWLRTGDIGYADEDGCFFIVDRLKELIKYKGLQIAPAELEALLLTHPGVADAAVIPSKDVEAGEVPKAFIVPKTAGLSASEIMEFVGQRVAPFKKIRRVEFIEAIPKTASGKILRRALLDRDRNKTQVEIPGEMRR